MAKNKNYTRGREREARGSSQREMYGSIEKGRRENDQLNFPIGLSSSMVAECACALVPIVASRRDLNWGAGALSNGTRRNAHTRTYIVKPASSKLNKTRSDRGEITPDRKLTFRLRFDRKDRGERTRGAEIPYFCRRYNDSIFIRRKSVLRRSRATRLSQQSHAINNNDYSALTQPSGKIRNFGLQRETRARTAEPMFT